MPTYEHECTNPECKYEWEDIYSIKADPIKLCPKCNKETAKRVVSLTAKGVVELYGNELVAKVKEDAQKLKKDVSKNENLYANLLGEDKMQKVQQSIDKQKKG